jgi:hypothetical protein
MSAHALRKHHPRRHHPVAPSAAAGLSYDDTMFSLMYGAMINQLGLSPSSFQLIYPFVSWNWPVTPTGYVSSAEFDFCATLPQWSAVGAYESSGARFDQAYGEFLSTISPATTNPTLQGQIANANSQLQLASNAYNTLLAQATAAYQAAVGSSNSPSFTAWLGTPGGMAWSSQLNSSASNVTQASAVYNALVAQTQTPALNTAIAAYTNQSYYSKLQDSGLSGFPAVPNYQVSNNPATWTQNVQAGGGTPGTVKFSMGQQAYDYSNTWAQSSSVVDAFFFSIVQNNSWQQITQFQSAQSLGVEIDFAAWDQIQIQPDGWYTGSAPRFYQNGPFNKGYTGHPDQAGDTPAFGGSGYMNALKTGMIVAYQPKIIISTDSSTFNSVQSNWNSSSGIAVGPFYFNNSSSGGQQYSFTASAANNQLIVQSTSTTPVIIGVDVDILP